MSTDTNDVDNSEASLRRRRAAVVQTHTGALRKALIHGTIALAVLMVLAAVVWTVIDGTAGLWGALIGAAIAGSFVLITALTALATVNSSPATTGAVMLGTWLVKIIIAIGVVAVLKDYDFYSRGAFLTTLILAMVVVLTIETRAIVTAKVPVVELPDTGPGAPNHT